MLPFVTVIMPIRNEAEFITRSLGAVLAQDYPHDRLEALIADGMSSDETRTLVQRLATDSDIPVRIVDNPGMIVPTGFNAALAQARGEIIVRVDGHTLIATDYVRNCVETLEATGADNVGGRMDAIAQATPSAEAIALATSSPFGVGGARFHYSTQQEYVDTVYMGAWPRRVFDQIGGFDEELIRNQDDEFNYRLRAAGGKILLNPRIESQYYNRSTIRPLARQYFQYGLFKVRILQKHPAQMRIRQFVPPLFVLALIGGALLSPFSPLITALWKLILALYVTGNIVFSWRLARSAKQARWIQIAGVFLVLHLCYGSGFLAGLFKFWKRWLG
ncbi:MAG: glycosyltransferase family 2 protein [Chloroflexota bacterium]